MLTENILTKEEKASYFIIRFICESNAIENIRTLYPDISSDIKNSREVGHARAIIYLERMARNIRGRVIQKEIICEVQKFIVGEQYKDAGGVKLPLKFIGKYRDVNVRVGYEICPAYDIVEELMSKLIADLREWQNKISLRDSLNEDELLEEIDYIADFHYRFEKIHPFADGNGRTGRALAYYLFRCVGITPFIFTSRDKGNAYYPCFVSDNSKMMKEYFRTKYNSLPELLDLTDAII